MCLKLSSMDVHARARSMSVNFEVLDETDPGSNLVWNTLIHTGKNHNFYSAIINQVSTDPSTSKCLSIDSGRCAAVSVKRIISPRRHTPEIELPAPLIPSQGSRCHRNFVENNTIALQYFKLLYLIFAQTNKLTHRD